MKTFALIALAALAITSFGVYKYVESNKATTTYAQKLTDIANKVNTMNTTWKADVNVRWENHTEESIKGMFTKVELMGLNRGKDSDRITYTKAQRAAAPESFDARVQWPKCESLKEIRDQSSCGSCWAFGATETMSDRICIHSGQTDQRRVSAEDLMECCSSCGDGCNGGFPFSTFEYWKKTGIVTGDLYGDKKYCKAYKFAPCAHHSTSTKYAPCPSSEYESPSCKTECTNGDDYESSKTYAESIYTVSGEDDYKTELSTNGPMEVAFTVYEDFLTYKSGVYQHVTGGMAGGHAVKMIGYGTENGTPYWLVVNSWNETWGDNGTFKILRGSDECGMEDEGDAGVPKL